MVIARDVILILAIVLLATLATVLFGGMGASEPFDLSLDQMPLPF
jgi:hypothetical protein